MLHPHQQLQRQRRSPLKCQLLYNEFYREGPIYLFSPIRIKASNHLCISSTRRPVIPVIHTSGGGMKNDVAYRIGD